MTIATPEGVTTRPVGLDYTAILLAGAARRADMPLLAEILPLIEPLVLDPDPSGGDDDDD